MRVPYYIVFDRSSDRLRAFRLTGSRYQELELSEPRVWMEDIELGLGLWEGKYENISRQWLRWYDRSSNWIPNLEERAEQEKQRADKLAAKLRVLGLDPDLDE